MRKRRKENLGLPSRWCLKHGAYYYQVPPGLEAQWDAKKLFRLGATLSEAYSLWAKRIGLNDRKDILTVAQLLKRYILEVTSKKAVSSMMSESRMSKQLISVFGPVKLDDVTPQDIYKYVDKRDAKVRARREKSLLSHAFTKAVEWGYIKHHPFIGQVRLKGEEARTRYIEDWELNEVRAMKNKRKGDPLEVIQSYLEVKYLTGLRQGDMLRLPAYHGAVGDKIRVTTNKTGKTIDLEVSEALHDALTRCMAVRPRDIAPWLFCTREGKPFCASGWQSNWQRFMTRVLAETKITERFTEHDIRAKSGSDSVSIERAQQLLTHNDAKTTVRAYRRKIETVMPLR